MGRGNNEARLRRKVGQRFGGKQDNLVGQPATVGDETGVVNVPGMANYIYCQTPGGVVPVYNGRINNIAAGMQVQIGYDPTQRGRLQVLSASSDYNTFNGAGTPPGGAAYPPAIWYQWWATGGGNDPLYLALRAWLPLRVAPAGGMNVSVYPDEIFASTGVVSVADQTVDLTSHIPDTADTTRWALIYLDDSGVAQVAASTPVAYGSFTVAQIPVAAAFAAGATHLLAAVRLFAGQTAVVESRAQNRNDLLDLRWPGAPRYDLFYTKTQLNTAGAGGQVHWDNIIAKPLLSPLFLHEEDSDVSGYERLLDEPANGAETIDSVVVTSGSGEVVIDEYITYPVGGLGRALIDGGAWHFVTYAKVNNTAGVSEIVIRVYKRSQAGSETQLFSLTTGEINATTPTTYEVETIQPDFVIDPTDRLVVKYFGKTDSGASITISLYYEGTAHYSHIHVPLQAGGSWTDEKVGVSASDTNPGYLSDKLAAGDNVSLSINNPGDNETYEIDFTLPDHTHTDGAGDGGAFPLTNLTSGTATAGQVPTADGAGGVAWDDVAGSFPALVVAAYNASDASKLGADYVCDGTNDEQQLIDAVAALPAAGGRVVLSEGTFKFSHNYSASVAAAFSKSFVTISGQGASTIIELQEDVAAITLLGGSGGGWYYPQAQAKVTIENITFTAATARTGTAILAAGNVNRLAVRGCYFLNLSKGIRFQGWGHAVQISENYFEGNRSAITASDGGAYLHDFLITNNKDVGMEVAGRDGTPVYFINVTAGQVFEWIVSANSLEHIYDDTLASTAINIRSGQNADVQIIGNNIEECNRAINFLGNYSSGGMVLSNLQVQGNTFRDIGWTIWAEGSATVLSVGNMFLNPFANVNARANTAHNLTAGKFYSHDNQFVGYGTGTDYVSSGTTPAGMFETQDVGGALPSHRTQHEAGGSDAIKLDDLATPDDNTDLNASTLRHGLLPKLSGSASQFLNGLGQWVSPTGELLVDDSGAILTDDNDDLLYEG